MEEFVKEIKEIYKKVKVILKKSQCHNMLELLYFIFIFLFFYLFFFLNQQFIT